MGTNRQFLALAIYTFGFLFLVKDKRWAFLSCVVLACFFHKSAVVCIFALFLSRKISNKYLIAVLGIAILISMSGIVNKVAPLLSVFVSSEDDLKKMDTYMNFDYDVSVVSTIFSLFRKLIWIALLMIFDKYVEHKSKLYYTFFNLYFLGGGSAPGLNKKVVDSYLLKDGSRFTDQADYDKMQFYEEMQNRDPRLAQTIVTPGYKRIGQTTVTPVGFAAATTGYQIIKWVSTTASDGYNKSQNDIPLFRLSEVMLNFAEAKAELGTLTQADLDKSVKLIRDRVGMPNIDLATANATPDPYLEAAETGYPNVTGANKGVILEIRRERTIELLAEGLRYDDLMRWKAGKTFEQQFKGMVIPKLDDTKHFVVCDLNGNGVNDAEDVCIYEGDIDNIKANAEVAGIRQFLKLGVNLHVANGANGGNIIVHDIANNQRKWNEDRDYLYPIPQDQITIYGGVIKQNPGW